MNGAVLHLEGMNRSSEYIAAIGILSEDALKDHSK